MNEIIKDALKTLSEAALTITQQLENETPKQEAAWKKDLQHMIADNRSDTAAVFEKYGSFIDRNKEEEMDFCRKRVMASLEGFFEEVYEPKLLDDAMMHLDRYIKLSRR